MVVKKIAVLFSGSGSNLQSILDKLHGKIFDDIKIEVVLTLTNKPNAYGIKRAENFGLTSVVIDNKNFVSRQEFDKKVVEEIKKSGAELTVLAGFMRILTPFFCDNIKAINLHPSILPLFKGAHAIDESFDSDMQVGGVSVHWVSAELDGGKIIAQQTFQRENKTRDEWEAKIHEIEHELLPKTIIQILKDTNV
ncbi:MULTISPECIES: phosphoribosylglycinamide formyltransferase [unclassified Campylobacter]|uniref:phosphoribosylglycinamide formyltransferase n=1 Tax=unclassified Campylobacter TaxID=2593542 RepID=UPI0022E99DBD|nr:MULTISPECIES: phosphoribosylglycinamide formyltransferase [unclassified Campylobacter]MDA3080012.1 phosphoribosylglycinamide formyltransferase [Campylobacter sp. CS_NA2]MDA3081770.1 phosphoribosylglycinamide formyltransferase [Campylobacter sp. CS_NA1]MDA3086069.1 phosphoribosylglycinamide formyltransferase [Campylobacter sp. CS_ED1]MDA3090982.1 phosphoribosylglycinamide formyltransferase [Campylobacter sp. CS_ED2]WBR51250.1 phosphoribosylglycinamide formyltransferase [Campylobacter sp. CS_